jgi:hypothetical protein
MLFGGAMKRWIPAVVLLLVTAFLTATPAHADPYNCEVRDGLWSASAICHSGTGTYQVVTWCDGFLYNYRVRGPEVRVGNYSVATCDYYHDDESYNPYIVVLSV